MAAKSDRKRKAGDRSARGKDGKTASFVVGNGRHESVSVGEEKRRSFSGFPFANEPCLLAAVVSTKGKVFYITLGLVRERGHALLLISVLTWRAYPSRECNSTPVPDLCRRYIRTIIRCFIESSIPLNIQWTLGAAQVRPRGYDKYTTAGASLLIAPYTFITHP